MAKNHYLVVATQAHWLQPASHSMFSRRAFSYLESCILVAKIHCLLVATLPQWLQPPSYSMLSRQGLQLVGALHPDGQGSQVNGSKAGSMAAASLL
jgi:hypothetical protein